MGIIGGGALRKQRWRSGNLNGKFNCLRWKTRLGHWKGKRKEKKEKKETEGCDQTPLSTLKLPEPAQQQLPEQATGEPNFDFPEKSQFTYL